MAGLADEPVYEFRADYYEAVYPDGSREMVAVSPWASGRVRGTKLSGFTG